MLKYSVSFFALIVGVLSNISDVCATNYQWNNGTSVSPINLYSGDTLTVDKVSFSGGNSWGYALMNASGGEIKSIKNSTFQDYEYINDDKGAIIYVGNGGKVSLIENSKFINTRGGLLGGAINGSMNGEFVIKGSTFDRNRAGSNYGFGYLSPEYAGGGGAINIGSQGNSSGTGGLVLKIQDTTFSNNHSQAKVQIDPRIATAWGGGAIRLDSGKMYFSGDNTFTDNWAGLTTEGITATNRNDILLVPSKSFAEAPSLYVTDGHLTLDGGIRGVRFDELNTTDSGSLKNYNPLVQIEKDGTLVAQNNGNYTLIRGAHVVNNGTVRVGDGKILLFFDNGTATGIPEGGSTVQATSYGEVINNGVIENNSGELLVASSILEMGINSAINGAGTTRILAAGQGAVLGQTLNGRDEKASQLYVSGTNARIENKLVNDGNITVAEGKDLTLGGELTNNGGINVNQSATLGIAAGGTNAGTITNSGTLTFAGNETTNFINNNIITNNSKLNVNGGTLTLNKGVDGTGNLNIGAQGTVVANAANITIAGGVSNSGNLNVAENAGLTVKGTVENLNAITNNGTLTAENGVVNQGTLTNNNEMRVNGNANNSRGGEIVNEGKFVAEKDLLNSGTITNNQNMTVKGNANNSLGGEIVNEGTFVAEKDLLNSGTITNNQNMTVNGELTNSSGGTLTNNGTLTARNDVVNQGTLTNNKDMTVSGKLNNSATSSAITNAENGTLTLVGGGTNVGTITNSGTLTIAGDETTNFTNNGTLTNNSKLDVNVGTLTLNKGVDGTGNLNIGAQGMVVADAADVTIRNTVANQGTVGVSAEKSLTLAGGGTNAGTITNDGTLTFTGDDSTNFINNNIITNNSTLNVNDGTLTLNKGIAGEGQMNIGADGVVTANAKGVEVNNTISNAGRLAVAENAELTLKKELTNNGTLSNAGKLILEKGVKGKGTFENNENMTVAESLDMENALSNLGTVTILEDKALTLKNGGKNDGTFTNNGVLNIGSDGDSICTFTLNNGIGGSGHINIRVDGELKAKGSDVVVSNGVTNAGKLTVAENAGLTVKGTVENLNAITNDGTFVAEKDLLNSGTITNNQNMTVSGKLNNRVTSSAITNDGKLTLAQGGDNNGSITNTGTLVSEGMFTNKGTLDNSADMTVKEALSNRDGGTLTNNGTLTAENDVVNQGTLTNNKDMTVSGKLNNSATSSAITNAKNGTLTLAGGGTNAGTITNSGTLTIAGDETTNFTNNGTLTNNSKLDVNVGTLTLNKGVDGTGNLNIGAQGTVVADAADVTIRNTVANQGTVGVSAEKSLTLAGGGTNDGTITNSGTLTFTGDDSTNFINNNIITNNSKLNVNGGTLTLNKGVDGTGNLNIGAQGTVVANAEDIVIANTVRNDGEFAVAKTAELTLKKELTNNGTLSNEGTLVAQNLTNNKLLYNNGKLKADKLSLASGSETHLGVSSVTEVGDYAADNALLTVDMRVNDEGTPIENGLLKVGGNVSGKTNVIVNALTPTVYAGASTLYVDAPNDTTGTDESFTVARVIGSPYMWDSKRVADGKVGNQWYLNIAEDRGNDDYDGEIPEIRNPLYAPEVNAYTGLAETVVEQNRGIAEDVRNGLAFEKSVDCYQERCGVVGIVPHKQAWGHVSNRNATLNTPADVDAKIWGFTGGADFYRDYDRRAGVFGFYRTGDYDLSGDGKYQSELGADIDNKSYAGGLYYQFDNGDNKLLSTLYAGRQNIDFKADDNFADASTDALQFGASIEGSHRYRLTDAFALEPGVGMSYMMADIDSFTDSVGKSVSYDTLHYWEAEAGIKAEYTFCNNGLTNQVYIRPSIVQTFANGDKVEISGISGKTNTYKNQTLGRVRTGAQFGLSQKLSGFADVGYTFGSDYEAYDLQFGLTYSF